MTRRHDNTDSVRTGHFQARLQPAPLARIDNGYMEGAYNASVVTKYGSSEFMNDGGM